MGNDWMKEMDDQVRSSIRAQEDAQIARRTYGTYDHRTKKAERNAWDIHRDTFGYNSKERP